MPNTAHLPLRTVSQLTGLSPDVVRAWEKRYQVVSPVRGPRGARLYTNQEVAHLRLLASAVASGRSIGDIAHLDRAALERLAVNAAALDDDKEFPGVATEVIERSFAAIEAFDPDRLHATLSEALIGLGTVSFIQRVATPLLEEVGERWSRGDLTVADEHLVSGVLRGLLSSLLHSRGRSSGPRLLLATPAGEEHDFGTLIVALLAADAGIDVVYLGANLPADEIIDAANRCDARVVGLGVCNCENLDRATAATESVAKKLPLTTELWLGGRCASDACQTLANPSIKLLTDLDMVRAELVRLRAEAPSLGR